MIGLFIFMLTIIGIIIFAIRDYMRIDWKVHLDMTKCNSEKYGHGTYDDFIKYFNLYELAKHRNYNFEDSFIDHSTDSEYHASIIRFNNQGMLLNYSDYKKVKKFIKELINEMDKDNLYNNQGVKW